MESVCSRLSPECPFFTTPIWVVSQVLEHRPETLYKKHKGFIVSRGRFSPSLSYAPFFFATAKQWSQTAESNRHGLPLPKLCDTIHDQRKHDPKHPHPAHRNRSAKVQLLPTKPPECQKRNRHVNHRKRHQNHSLHLASRLLTVSLQSSSPCTHIIPPTSPSCQPIPYVRFSNTPHSSTAPLPHTTVYPTINKPTPYYDVSEQGWRGMSIGVSAFPLLLFDLKTTPGGVRGFIFVYIIMYYVNKKASGAGACRRSFPLLHSEPMPCALVPSGGLFVALGTERRGDEIYIIK